MSQAKRKGWIPRKLNELGFVGRGKSRHRPRNDPSLYGGIYPLIQTAEVTASEFYITEYSQTYSEAGLAQSKMWDENTLCIVNAGENTAETAILKFRACFPDSIIAFIADPKKSDVRFVKYYLSVIKSQLRSVTKGATQDNLSVEKLLAFDIFTPPIVTQHKIADILSAYEDLIENNTRQMEILEEMAQLIYREWFVNFCFPGYEQVKMTDLGIPEHWDIKNLSSIAQITMGQSPKSEFYNTQVEGLPFHQGVANFGVRFPIDMIYCTVFNRIAEAGDILFSVRAPVGRLNIANKKIIIGRGLCGIRSKTGHQAFIFQQLKDKFQEEDVMGSGTIFKSVTKADMETVKMLVPPLSLLDGFENYLQPIYRNLEIATAENANLRKTRDFLLPKLISGEIDLEKIDTPELILCT
ncbi:MAG: restriction endonuclease subunit S, partial [Tolypothrix sp. Co-bin9]|nr:restriction endonuclease subunit S [Tolypothrix sp. Co-bin9]